MPSQKPGTATARPLKAEMIQSARAVVSDGGQDACRDTMPSSSVAGARWAITVARPCELVMPCPISSQAERRQAWISSG